MLLMTRIGPDASFVTDVLPATSLGGRAILVRTGYGTDHESRVPADTDVVDDLPAAAALILASGWPSVDPKSGLG